MSEDRVQWVDVANSAVNLRGSVKGWEFDWLSNF
jgi:hypothetical protein